MVKEIPLCLESSRLLMMMMRKIDILGLSETKWPGQGMKQMRRGHHIVWSGEKEEKRKWSGNHIKPRNDRQSHTNRLHFRKNTKDQFTLKRKRN
jgi:hypothetical protein